jgi:hypothetical protein
MSSCYRTAVVGLFVLAQLAYADGIHFSEEELHLGLPDQKAVISWDGETEEMILSSAVRSDDLSNIVWVVPIQSSTKPEVEAADIAVFKELVQYFGGRRPVFDRTVATNSRGAGVEVVEAKEVDIYDITILKSSSGEELLSWLNSNHYHVPQNAAPVLDKYAQKENMHFIANRLDLRNKFKKEIDALPELLKQIREKWETAGPALLTSFYVTAKKGLAECQCRSTEPKYGVEKNCALSLKAKMLYDNYFQDESAILQITDKINSSPRYFCEAWAYKDASYHWLEWEPTGAVIKRVEGNTNAASTRGYFIAAKTLDGLISQSADLNLYDYCKALLAIKDNLATPLKITFKPAAPVYPLEISSIGGGVTNIQVYVLSSARTRDANCLLRLTEAKEITSQFRTTLAKHIDPGPARYVSRLVYWGPLQELRSDAHFIDLAQNNYRLSHPGHEIRWEKPYYYDTPVCTEPPPLPPPPTPLPFETNSTVTLDGKTFSLSFDGKLVPTN